MSASKEKIRVSFGHNSENVTGSYTLIECGQSGKKILVDFGMIQENVSLLKEYQMNAKRPDFKPKEIDYVFLTHAHIDHSGRLGMLYKWGCQAPLIAPQGSSDLIKAMLLDSANIMTRDAEDLTKKLKKEYEPLCEESDIYNAIRYLKEYPVGEKIKIDDDIEFLMTYNGHIFKSVSFTFWIKNGSQTRKIIISGDIGNISCQQKFTEKFVPFENCNLLIGECTYSDKERIFKPECRQKDIEKIIGTVNSICIDRKGKILIPTFAFGRSPTILATLYDIFKNQEDFNIPVIYASPLGSKLMKIMLEELDESNKEYLYNVLHWKNLKILDNFEQLESEIKDSAPKIICCPSGMMTAGYSVFVGSQLLPHSNNCIMFCGYSSEGSLARKIKDKKTKTISIDGKSIAARCQVITLKSFSSHMQYDDLLKIYSQKDGHEYEKIALVHGNQNNKIDFAHILKQECEKRNKTTKIIAVNKSTEITL